ncbi:unknown protein [Microcystis aeruginosa NIES-843]|uniref:Uncharacterized protein n=1 Tax=Microcystis aeruginosa (strain NIES-843 / IAM M-2473) TaxID=449447 RepID=B0JJ66_MICAN|nr:unknown protein [Microcystis aeruginosa NIES-843]
MPIKNGLLLENSGLYGGFRLSLVHLLSGKAYPIRSCLCQMDRGTAVTFVFGYSMRTSSNRRIIARRKGQARY